MHFKTKTGNFIFIKTAPVAKVFQGNSIKDITFFVMDIYGIKFQEHCFNIPRGIVYPVFTTFQLQYYDIITDLICIIEKRH